MAFLVMPPLQGAGLLAGSIQADNSGRLTTHFSVSMIAAVSQWLGGLSSGCQSGLQGCTHSMRYLKSPSNVTLELVQVLVCLNATTFFTTLCKSLVVFSSLLFRPRDFRFLALGWLRMFSQIFLLCITGADLLRHLYVLPH